MSGLVQMLLIASVAAPGLGELFTSIAHMQAALYAERDIAEEIREYIRVEEEKLNKLKRYFFCSFHTAFIHLHHQLYNL